MIQFGRLSWYGVAEGNTYREIDFNSPAVVTVLERLERFSRKNVYTLPLHEAGRPDRTSLSIYKNANYFWILLQVNGIQDPFQEWEPLRKIIYPDVGDIANALNTLGVSLKLEDDMRVYLSDAASDLGSTKPHSGV